VFWAGRDDKKACNKHLGTIRKRKQRQKAKTEQAKTEEQVRAQRKEAAIKRLSRTAVALLNAIVIHGHRVFWKIDNAAWKELRDDPSVLRVSNPHVVRQTLNMLVNRGYLRHSERAGRPREGRYEPRQKLIDLW